jgi:hypothetical protein
MGRKKKFLTQEEKVLAQKEYCKKYYERNKDVLNKKSMKKYYERVGTGNLQDYKPD